MLARFVRFIGKTNCIWILFLIFFPDKINSKLVKRKLEQFEVFETRNSYVLKVYFLY